MSGIVSVVVDVWLLLWVATMGCFVIDVAFDPDAKIRAGQVLG